MVAAGEPVVVVEAMKIEHTLAAPVAGSVELLVNPGAQVQLDQLLARIVSDAEQSDGERPHAVESAKDAFL